MYMYIYIHVCMYIDVHMCIIQLVWPPQIFDHAEGYASYERAYQHKVPPNPEPYTPPSNCLRPNREILERFKEFDLEEKAIIWPWLSCAYHILSTAALCPRSLPLAATSHSSIPELVSPNPKLQTL